MFCYVWTMTVKDSRSGKIVRKLEIPFETAFDDDDDEKKSDSEARATACRLSVQETGSFQDSCYDVYTALDKRIAYP